VLSLRLSGAGGYGEPEKRLRSAIEEDLRQGFITDAHARDAYHYPDKFNKV